MLSERRKVIKRQALNLYYEHFTECVILGFIALTVTKGIESIGQAVFSRLRTVLTSQSAAVVYLFILVGVFVLVCPLFFGIFSHFADICSNRKSSILKISVFYSSRKMFRCALICSVSTIMLALFDLCAPVVMKSSVDILLLRNILGITDSNSVRAVLNISVLVISVVLFIASSGFMCVPIVVLQNNVCSGIFAARQSFSYMHGHKFECFMLCLSFLPLCIISYFAFGILFIPFVIPYIVLSVCCFLSYVTAQNASPVFCGFSD